MSLLIPRRGSMQFAEAVPPGNDFMDEVLADSSILAWATPEGEATAIDQSGNGRDGTVTFGTNAPGPLAGFDALDFFGGSSSGIRRVDEAALDYGDIVTYEIIFKRGRLLHTSGEQLFHKGTNSPVLFFPANSNTPTLSKSGGSVVVAATVDVDDTDDFHHLMVAKDGASSVLMVLDGVDVTGVVTDQTMASTTSDLGVGCTNAGGNSLDGVIAFSAVYPTALSLARAQAHHAAIA